MFNLVVLDLCLQNYVKNVVEYYKSTRFVYFAINQLDFPALNVIGRVNNRFILIVGTKSP